MTSSRLRGRPSDPDLLTPAEWRVVEAVRHGLTNPAIAEKLGVSVDAVKFHVGNALQKLGMRRRAQLRQWNGIRQRSELSKMDLAQGAIALDSIGQISRSVRDVQAAEAWYRDVLGLRHLYTFGTLAFFDCGGVRLLLSQDDGPAPSLLYFRVADVRSGHAALQARGIEFIAAPHLIHRHADGVEEWMAFFKDNEGRPLALMAQTPATGTPATGGSS